ncbi:Gfo/Idh/MocA family protein [Cohnella caldifontis]|uniref:Gfo/Idh/MocA family protein n=1 Tax=Cohnella caldifontis TaxID=3027471 RepID=UPI0023ECD4A4|nr:Gfo/Idh/MocA family oxidoreductase [Cohnella sp. YIM B05605]
MTTWRAAVIGCGRPNAVSNDGKQGFGIAYLHGQGYVSSTLTTLCAVADIAMDNAQAYANHFGVERVYADYREMLHAERPDLVSICTWPRLHKEMVLAAAEAGVKGILCEKPMTVHYKDALEMHEICRKKGIVLHVNHQRRYDFPFIKARELADAGEIGRLLRLEAWVGDGWDLMSWGVHWIDMMRFYTHDANVRNVFAQADVSKRTIRYEHPVEDRILMQLKFDNEVQGILHLSEDEVQPGNLLVGEEGMILFYPEIRSPITVVGRSGTRKLEWPDDAKSGFQGSVEHLALSVQTGLPSDLDSGSALINMQIAMAAFQSARTHRTIDLPFEDPVNPLVAWFGMDAAAK